MVLQAYVEGQFVFELTDFKGAGAPANSSEALEPQVVPARNHSTRKTDSTETVDQAETISVTTSHLPEVASGVGSQPVTARPNRIELAIDASEAADLLAEQGIEICVEGSKEFVGGSRDLSDCLFSVVKAACGRERQVIVKVIEQRFRRDCMPADRREQQPTLNFNLPTYLRAVPPDNSASTALGNDEIRHLIKRR
jgi:hypothetical protein